MSMTDHNQPNFSAVSAELSYHAECGHYHVTGVDCPVGRCDSYLCCQPGEDAPDNDLGVYENRAAYGCCATCFESRPLLGHAGLTACHNAPLIYI